MASLVANEKPQYARLPSQDDRQDEESISHHSQIQHELNWRRRFYILLFCSASAISAVVGGSAYKLRTAGSAFSCPILPTNHGDVEIPYSPAPVKYVNKLLVGDPDTPKFMGQPRPELDEAWHELLDATLIRYSGDELRRANNATSVRHKDGGFVGGLGISHSLHCLKRIKQYIHPQYYYGHEEQNWDELYSHVDHCLESLRQEVLCSADVNVYTLKWTRHSRFKPTVKVPQPHACVDWAALHGWMKGRAARLDDMVGPPESLYEDH
ncbi:hypothetical protein C8A01DRAFT_15489 [Parachaetomium inaequale]|uniref:Tat pathway signal sequence n=1 Tax=Parachaetomium inaequale TaxID=2588326 RepID=A0AAN6SSQ1_9PEZI|nr:hypothetical protein C8A01DRAFT_15489 [Parachaetomium inaequale]